MSWLDKIIAWLRAGPATRRKSTLFIADAVVLMGSARTNGRLSPKDQLQMLRRISLFAEQEGMEVWAVFEGRPLREVSHGDAFASGVRVFFADSADDLTNMIKDLAEKYAARAPLAVVANRRLEEELITRGIRVMRGNTFRKAVELAISSRGGGSQHPAAGDNGGGARRQRRQQKHRNKQPQQPSQKPAAFGSGPQPVSPETVRQQAPDTEAAVPTKAALAVDESVRKLIDLVE